MDWSFFTYSSISERTTVIALSSFLIYIAFRHKLLEQKFIKERVGIKVFIQDYSIILPIFFLYVYHRFETFRPIILIPGWSTSISCFLTFLTYILCRAMILWGLAGFISVQSRYMMFWFGLGGGIWSPIIRVTGLFYQPWILVFPYCIGGVYDMGPLIGQWVYRRAQGFFRRLLWCPLPSGIVKWDESHNVFDINYGFYDNFISIYHALTPSISDYRMQKSAIAFLPCPPEFTSSQLNFEYGWFFPLINSKNSDTYSLEVLTEFVRDPTYGKQFSAYFDPAFMPWNVSLLEEIGKSMGK